MAHHDDDARPPSHRPCAATAEQGAVLLDGPQGAILALTPEAALATGENLRSAAALAVAQRDNAVVRLRRKLEDN